MGVWETTVGVFVCVLLVCVCVLSVYVCVFLPNFIQMKHRRLFVAALLPSVCIFNEVFALLLLFYWRFFVSRL